MKFLCFMFLSLQAFAAVGSSNHNPLSPTQNTNAPWYPSLDAFEHYDSGRSHLFSQAFFAGNYGGGNQISTLLSPYTYPSVYNMTYLSSDQVYAYGGGYGNAENSIGHYVTQINPYTLEPIWYNQLTLLSGPPDTQDWDYPGVMGILEDGNLYVIYGYQLSKLNANTGAVLATTTLPTGGGLAQNTAYNGFDLTSDGFIVAKCIFRQAGCTAQGTSAAVQCPDTTTPSVLVSVNPATMQVVDQVTLPAPIFGRLTVGKYQGQDYIYLFSTDSLIRYAVTGGEFTFDSGWNTGNILLSGQTPGSACVVINDWVVTQCNGSFATTALSVTAVSQGDASIQFSIQPFLGDPVPLYIQTAFPGYISWIPSAISADPSNNYVYAMDSFPGKVAAIQVSNSGLNVVWTVDQRTTEFIALLGVEGNRVFVGTDIPYGQVPGFNTNDYVVWRNAATGQGIALSSILPAMTAGSMVQPYYFGNMFYEGLTGSFYKLSSYPGSP